MKKFANAEIEVVKFDNAVIATSGCTGGITGATNYETILYEYDILPAGEQSFEEYLAQNNYSFDVASNMIV